MFNFGAILFIISGFVVFGSDTLYRKGKVQSLKDLLKIKVFGLSLAVLGTLLMFYGNR